MMSTWWTGTAFCTIMRDELWLCFPATWGSEMTEIASPGKLDSHRFLDAWMDEATVVVNSSIFEIPMHGAQIIQMLRHCFWLPTCPCRSSIFHLRIACITFKSFEFQCSRFELPDSSRNTWLISLFLAKFVSQNLCLCLILSVWPLTARGTCIFKGIQANVRHDWQHWDSIQWAGDHWQACHEEFMIKDRFWSDESKI